MSYQKELDKARGTYVNAKDKMASYSSLIGDWKKEDYENSVFAKQNNSINTLLQSFKSGSITLKDFENKVNSIINSAQKMADAVSNSRKKTDELLTGLKDPLYQSQYADIENQQKQLESSYLNGKITLTEYNREYKSLYKTINDVSKQQQAEYSFQEQINRAYRNSVNVIESYRDLLGDGAVSSQYEILNSNFDNAVQHQDIKEFVNYASSLDEQFSLMSSSIDEVWKSWDRLQESFVGSDWLGNDEFTANVIETGKSISNFANDLLSGNISLTQFSTDSFSAMQVLSKIAHNVEEFYGIFDQDNLIPEFSQAFIDLKDRFDKLNTVFQNGTIDAKEYTEEVQRLLDVASDPKWKASNDKGTLIGSAATREAAINDIKEMAKDLKLVGGRLEAIEENGQVQGFVGQIRVGNNEIQKIYFNLEDIQNGLVGIRQQTSENIHYTSRWEKAIEAIRNRWNQVGTWAASFLSFEKMRSVVRNGIDIIRELDEEYANLLKVSNDSASSIRQFTKDSFDIADRIGSSAKTVQAAAVEWSRLGYSIKEASQLAEASTVFVNVGDGIDAATATKDLVSALAAFHMEASEAMSIVDKLNEIGK